jgi:molecular chaperone GrpE
MSEEKEIIKEEEVVEKKKEHKDKHSEKIKKLEEKIQELEEVNKKLQNDFYKAYADAENIKRRNQQDLEVAKKYRIQSFASDILPVIDNLERALETIEDKESSVAKGVLMTYNQLIESLKKEGVEEIIAEGMVFDPNFHQPLMMEKVEGLESNKVIQVLQKGYKLKDRLLRPSLVKVSE